MAKIERFEDLRCWQNARLFVKTVFLLEGKFETDWEIKGQFRRASLSIMNNIAEGFSRLSKKEFARFLEIAQSSATECKSMLYVLEDLNYLPPQQLEDLHAQVDLIKHQTLAMMRYLKRPPQ